MVSAEATILTMTARNRIPLRVVMDGRDGGIGTVALGLGSEPIDEHRSEQRAQSDDQRERPWPGERRRSRVSALAGRRGHVVAGQEPEEEVGAG